MRKKIFVRLNQFYWNIMFFGMPFSRLIYLFPWKLMTMTMAPLKNGMNLRENRIYMKTLIFNGCN